MGLFGGSSKSSSEATDKRLVTGEGSTGISADNSNVDLFTQLVSNTNQTDNSLMSWANNQTDSRSWANSQTDSRSWANSETDNSTSTVNVTDSGIVARALDSIDMANATNGTGFSKLLDTGKSIFETSSNSQGAGLASLIDAGKSLFNKASESQTGIFSTLIDAGKSLIGQTQQSVSDAYQTATAEKSGALDNKTLMILGVAAIAGVAIVARGNK